MSVDTVICPFDPTKECTCASKSFAADIYNSVIGALKQSHGMTEGEAIAEYQKGDFLLRQLASPDEHVNNCTYATMKKIVVKRSNG